MGNFKLNPISGKFDLFSNLNSSSGSSLPDATTTKYTHFLLTDQTDISDNGWYKNNGTFWAQITSGASNTTATIGRGETLPDATSTPFDLFVLSGVGLFFNNGGFWVQEI